MPVFVYLNIFTWSLLVGCLEEISLVIFHEISIKRKRCAQVWHGIVVTREIFS